jgi:hypothetical protein
VKGLLSSERGSAIIFDLILLVLVVGVAGLATFNYYQQNHTTNPAVSPIPHRIEASMSPSPTPSPTPATMAVFGTTVPSDFGNFLNGVFETDKKTCSSETFSGVQVVRNEFASVNESCGAGAVAFYAKVNSQWQYAFGTQNVPYCSDVNKYSFTKELVPQCWRSNGTLQANENP